MNLDEVDNLVPFGFSYQVYGLGLKSYLSFGIDDLPIFRDEVNKAPASRQGHLLKRLTDFRASFKLGQQRIGNGSKSKGLEGAVGGTILPEFGLITKRSLDPRALILFRIQNRPESRVYAKFASTSVTAARLENEARWLSFLPSHLRPDLVHHGEYDGVYSVTTRHVSGAHPNLEQISYQRVYGFCCELQELSSVKPLPPLEQIYETTSKEFRRRISQLPEDFKRVWCSHGDLAIWNLLVNEQHRITALDWEYAHTNGTPLSDFLYCYLSYSILLCRDSIRVSYEKLIKAGRAIGLEERSLETLLLLFLLSKNVPQGLTTFRRTVLRTHGLLSSTATNLDGCGAFATTQ